MITSDFVTAGDATFTIRPAPAYIKAQATRGVEAKPWYTFRVRYKEAHESNSKQYNEAWFVYLLTGQDNESDYLYLGILNPDSGKVTLTKASCAAGDAPCVVILRRVLAAIFEGRAAQIEGAGWKVYHEGRCGCCGRKLTTPKSLERGIGPECAARMGDECECDSNTCCPDCGMYWDECDCPAEE